jgi:protein-arginine deiminase
MRCAHDECNVASPLRLCLRCQNFYCAAHYAWQAGTCLPADDWQREQLLAARERRRIHDEEVARETRHLGLAVRCRQKTLTVIVVDDASGMGIANLPVTLRVGEHAPASQGGGRYHFSALTDGTVYTVRVQAPPAYGEAIYLAGATAGQDASVTLRLRRYTLRMAVDADRDGAADDPAADFSTWSRGPASSGAVVFFNNLNSTGQSSDDYHPLPIVNAADETMSPGELPYLAPLDIVCTGYCSGNYVATLRAAPAGMLRIFHEGTAVLGPQAASWTLPNLQDRRFHCLMEATSYPKQGFNGLVTLTLELDDGAGRRLTTQQAQVRVSPWLMHHALDELSAVYAFDIANLERMDQASYDGVRDYLDDLVQALGPKVVLLDFDDFALENKADLFIRDVMALGYSSIPMAQGAQHVDVVLGPMHDRDGSNIHRVAMSLSSATTGFHLPSGLLVDSDDTCNYYGNFLCSPPTPSAPLGRIFYGINGRYALDKDLLGFLQAQCQPLCPLDVGWLTVRHVDEVLSFVPKGTAPGFAVVVPSPRFAIHLLEQAHAQDQFATILAGQGDHARTVASLVGDPRFMQAQGTTQAYCDALAEKVCKELGIATAHIIRLPVLFELSTDPLLPLFSAVTPNVVNMLVGTRADGVADLCIAKPYGPVIDGQCSFEEAIEQALTPTGNIVHWIRDFGMYHQSDGEVHCATNSRRIPRNPDGWWRFD